MTVKAKAGIERLVAALRLIGVGFFIGSAITLGVLGGLWLDNRLGTGLFWLGGLILGLVVAFYGVFKMLLPFIGDRRDKEND